MEQEIIRRVFEWTCLVDGRELSVNTEEKNLTSAKIEFVKANNGILNEKNALKYFSELEKKHQIEFVGVKCVKISVKY